MRFRPHPRLRHATAFATLLALLAGGEVRAASKIQVAAIGDRAPGGGQFLGPSLTSTPSAAGNGWVAFRTLVTSGGTSEQIVAKNMIPGTVNADVSTFVVAEIGKSAGKADDKDLGSFKQFLGRPAINANGDVAFVATLSNSDRLPSDLSLDTPTGINPAGVFLYRRAIPGREAHLSVVALARDDVPGIGLLDFGQTIDILSGSLTAIDVQERTPAINDAGDVAFTSVIAPQPVGNPSGAVFFAPQGFNPTPVVRLGDVVDGGTFTVVGPPSLNDAGTIAFRGLLDDVNDGIFEYAQGVTRALVTTGRVVITNDPFPFPQFLLDFGEVVTLNAQGDVAFTAGPIFDLSLDSNDVEGAPGVFVLHGDQLVTPGYPGRIVAGRGRITDVTLGPDGGNDIAAPALAADGTLVFFGELNNGRQQALFRVAPPWDSPVLIAWIRLGGTDPSPSPIQGTYQAAGSAPVVDAAGNVTLFARIAGSVTSEALLFLPPGGGAQYVLVGQATPTKGLFGGPPFSSVVLTDAGDVFFKSFVAAGPSGLGLFRWHPTGDGRQGDTTLVARTGDAAPLDGAPRFIDLVGDASANANGDVAFSALVDHDVGRSVFAASGGAIRAIALPNQDIPTPPAPPASGFRTIATTPMMLADGSVVFRGIYDHPDPLLPFNFVVEDGVFVSDPSGGLRLLAHSGEDSGFGKPFFRFRDTTVSSGGSIGFRSSLGDEFDIDPPLGLFVVDPSATIRAIVMEGQTIGTGVDVRTFSGRPAIDGAGNVAFLADVNANQLEGTAVVRSATDGGVTLLAQVGADGPRGGKVKSLSRPIMSSNGHVAFRASFDQGTGGTAGFFLNTESGTVPLVSIGESDADGEGGRLSSLNPGASLNSSDRLAFVGSASQGKSRNGIFLATASNLTAQALAGRDPLSLDENAKPRGTIRGRVTLETSGLADGFDLTKDAVTIGIVDENTNYFTTTIAPNKLARQGDTWVLRRRQSRLRKLRIRAKRNTVRASFAAGGLDFVFLSPPFTIRLSVGNDGGVVSVPCTETDDRIVCTP